MLEVPSLSKLPSGIITTADLRRDQHYHLHHHHCDDFITTIINIIIIIVTLCVIQGAKLWPAHGSRWSFLLYSPGLHHACSLPPRSLQVKEVFFLSICEGATMASCCPALGQNHVFLFFQKRFRSVREASRLHSTVSWGNSLSISII